MPTFQKLHQALSTPLLSSLTLFTPQYPSKVRSKSVPPPEVVVYAKEHKVPFHLVPTEIDARKAFWMEFTPRLAVSHDLGVAVSFGQRLPPALLTAMRHGCINMHPSLLPEYRGAAPITWALIDGVEKSGVTVLEMTAGRFDSGPILGQRSIKVPPGATNASLSAELAEAGACLMLDCIRYLPVARSTARLQDESQASTAPKIHGGHACINFAEWDSRQLVRRHVALQDTHHLHAFVGGKRMIFFSLEHAGTGPSFKQPPSEKWVAGCLVRYRNELFLYCKDERWVRCHLLMYEGGKKPLTAEEFINGHMKPQNKLIIQLE